MVVLQADNDRTDQEIATLHAFVENGGGLIAAGQAWWWAYENDDVAADYPGNRILSEAGLTITDEATDPGRDEVPDEIPSDLLHAAKALDLMGRTPLGGRAPIL